KFAAPRARNSCATHPSRRFYPQIRWPHASTIAYAGRVRTSETSAARALLHQRSRLLSTATSLGASWMPKLGPTASFLQLQQILQRESGSALGVEAPRKFRQTQRFQGLEKPALLCPIALSAQIAQPPLRASSAFRLQTQFAFVPASAAVEKAFL